MITERAVFAVQSGGLVLAEAAKVIYVRRDAQEQTEFAPKSVAGPPKTMDVSLSH